MIMTKSAFRWMALTATVASLAIGSGVSLAQKGPTLTKAVQKSLAAADAASKKKNFAECVAKGREAEAVPNRTDNDNNMIAEVLGYCFVQQRDYTNATRYYEQTLGNVTGNVLEQRVRAISQMYNAQGNYAKAIEFGQRAIKGGYADSDMYIIVGQAYYRQGDYKTTAKFVGDYVNGIERNGNTPKEALLLIVFDSCRRLSDDACTTNTLEKLVRHYQKEDYWKNLMISIFRSGVTGDRATLQLYRLASEVNAMPRPQYYVEMAQLAIEGGFPGEAQTIAENIIAKKMFTEKADTERVNRLLASAKSRAATDKPQLTSEASRARSGESLVRLGEAYMGYGMLPQAVDALTRGLAAPGVKNPPDALLVLGIAQFKSGNKADALKAFGTVKGDAGLERLARLWTLRAQG
jgi:tetratricopeptide (TPR) repeat protein